MSEIMSSYGDETQDKLAKDKPLWRRLARHALTIPHVQQNYSRYLCYKRLQQETYQPLKNLNHALGLKTLVGMEGYISNEQRQWIQSFFSQHQYITSIAQTGFNGGHSAVALLETRSNIRLTSFDIHEHDYISAAEQYVNKTYPQRHTLIEGDSVKTVPWYKGTLFDAVFIDGGHEVDVAYADIVNLQRHTKPGGIIIVDDYLPHMPFGQGPVVAWQRAKDEGAVEEVGVIATEDNTRAWILGNYT